MKYLKKSTKSASFRSADLTFLPRFSVVISMFLQDAPLPLASLHAIMCSTKCHMSEMTHPLFVVNVYYSFSNECIYHQKQNRRTFTKSFSPNHPTVLLKFSNYLPWDYSFHHCQDSHPDLHLRLE